MLRKKIILLPLAIIALFNVALLIYGKTYFYTAIAKTYLSGQKGPDIYDLGKFQSRLIKNDKVLEWEKHPNYNKVSLNKEELSYNSQFGTEALVIIKDGKLIQEHYFNKHNDTTLANSFSVAKSLVSILVHCAQKDGYLSSFNEKVGTYLPNYNMPSYADLTLENLSAMSSGLSWSESGGNPFSDNAEAYYGKDLRALALTMKAEEKPGQHFVYKSGNTALLGMCLEKAIGMPISTYGSKKLWQKIGAEHPAFWSLDHANGFEKAYCCWYATAKDFAKLGQLMLQEGNWHGEQLLDSTFVADCRTPLKNTLPNGEANTRYSKRGWWLVQYKGAHYYYARGILGQYILILPEQNMVVVRLGHKRDEVDEAGHPIDIYHYIETALRNK